ncbi:MAG: WYL domain-containing protein [bacterium]|nr:WYL domain-containing protein [bacterium]
MESEKPRIARLTAIINQLQSKRMITAREIADKHGVSIRTVYRDIRTIENSGVPIRMIDGKGYSLVEGYRLAPVSFTESEANALITAEHIIARDKDKSLIDEYKSALIKVKAVLRYSQKEKTEILEDRIQIRNNPDNEQTSNFLIQLQSALTTYKVVELDYLSLEHQPSRREVEPFALFSTQGNWILVAHCRLKNAFRSFRLDCMRKIDIKEEQFEPHPMTLQQYFEECRKSRTTPDTPLTQDQNSLA